jgi:cytochrome P450
LRDDQLTYALELQRQYGDCASFRIGPMRIYQFAHPEQVSEICVKQAHCFHKVSSVKFYFKRWMRRGLLLNEGQDWQRQRRKVRWALTQIDASAVNHAIDAEVARLLSPELPHQVDMAAQMDRLAFGLNVRALFSADTEAIVEPLYEAANVLHATGIREMLSFSLLPDWLPIPSKRALRGAMRTFDQTLLGLARRRHAGDAPPDGMNFLVHARDLQGKTLGMPDRRARDEAVNLLMGGKETVGATLTFACYLLAQHPEIQAQAAAEAWAVCGERCAQLDDLDHLPVVTRVIRETMRLYPPVYSLSREVIRPVTIGGYRLPKRSTVIIPIYALHRDPRWFAEPERFHPERFAPQRQQPRPHYAYIPFGAGLRSCVGKELGFQQCVLVLASLLTRCQLRQLPTHAPPVLATDIVLHPHDGLPIVLESRQRSTREPSLT